MHKAQVRRFYEVLWDAHDTGAMPSILHEDLTFRGSLGQEKHGHTGFAEYVDGVHEALGEYRCHIDDLVEEGNKVFARMRFSGIHRDAFMGHPPTHKRVTWAGCALLTFEGERIADAWVLGDLASLDRQLAANATSAQ